MKTENNILLAKFLGWKLGHPELFELRWSNEWFDSDKQRRTTKGYLHFNSNWNWLMEVVAKIESIDNERFCFDISLSGARIEDMLNDFNAIVEIVAKTKIEAVYLACIEFVKWYNKQK